MWERTLQDLIRDLRANKQDEAKFISTAIDEIRQEIKSKDMELKAAAVLKLTYLDMLGYDMSWASFYVVEVMSSPKVHLKTVGYLAAAQSFTQDTDVLMLTTNQLKKDFTSRPEEVAISLNGFSQFVTPDLARDLSPDLVKMLSHSRPHVRKRAVVLLFKVFQKYPEVIPHAMGRIRERLEDPDPGVVSATINALCELARYNPADYLPLAPFLFHLLTTSNNNWMLIKIIKLFGTLTPHEPRLVKKLLTPMSDIISTTPAVSLLYECVRTCIIGGMLQGTGGDALARTCVSKLANFLQDEDQNLKYIALLAMVNIVPTHPHLVAEYQDMILSSVDDQDISIRMRALDLVSAMTNSSNLQAIVQQLLSHLVRTEVSALPSAAQSLSQTASGTPQAPRLSSPSQNPAYRLILSQRILTLCSQNTYEHVLDFEWYLSVLVDLAYVASVDIGSDIRDQLVDVTARVQGVQRFTVSLMVKLLCDDTFLMNAGQEGSCSEVLWAAAFICGEYCGELADPQKLLTYLLQPRVLDLAPDTIAVYLQATTKVFGVWASELADRWDNDDLSKVKDVVDSTIERLTYFVCNPNIEVQERAANMLQLFTFVRADLTSYRPPVERSFGYDDNAGSSSNISEPDFPKSLFLIHPLFTAYELNTVAPNAQASVPIPEGLDLDAWIVPPPMDAMKHVVEPDEDGTIVETKKVKKMKKGKGKETGGTVKAKTKKNKDGDSPRDTLEPAEEMTEAERSEQERLKAERLERHKDDPFYLTDDRHSKKPDQHDVDAIPVVRLDDLPPLSQAENSRVPMLRSNGSQFSRQTFVIDRVGEMPSGAASVASSSPSPAGSSTAPIVRRESPSNGNGAATAAPLSSFPAYELEDEIPRSTSTPPPIKVTRAKKKTKASSGTGKKRAVGSATSTPPGGGPPS
ncbi:AP-3 complex subunit delta [Steccherinum ochraceum]|uniref:AP-3 complex subunit delta n=1 Tax=Steccherinum ochraceum TaxID=92696 RepID=A0A4R0S1I6_9APHY|nr:AP-3 complex subunit delta [Steccherinum ochraceum]